MHLPHDISGIAANVLEVVMQYSVLLVLLQMCSTDKSPCPTSSMLKLYPPQRTRLRSQGLSRGECRAPPT